MLGGLDGGMVLSRVGGEVMTGACLVVLVMVREFSDMNLTLTGRSGKSLRGH